MQATIPNKGDRVTVPVLTGYVLAQNRPRECKSAGYDADGNWTFGCKCGKCGGMTAEYPGTVEKIIYWMDNSIEAEVSCDDGQTRILRLVYPHGDVCF